MEQENDRDYYRRREVAARGMAEKARDRLVAGIHTEMADRYAELALRPDRPALHVLHPKY